MILSFTTFEVILQNNQLTAKYDSLLGQYSNLNDAFNRLINAIALGQSLPQGQVSHLNYTITATITFRRNGKIVYEYAGLDPLTTQGLTLNLAKLTGNGTYYNMTTYNFNATWLSVGYGTVSSSSVVLPGEWDRVAGSQIALTATSFNMTATLIPPAGGPYSANCFGINYESATANTTDLYCYTTFGTVTGIDGNFTITPNVEVQLITS